MITNDVENYPGFPEKIAGPDLMKHFREQSLVQGVEIITDDVVKVDFSKRPFTVWVGDDEHGVPARDDHHRHGRAGQVAGPARARRRCRARA